MEEAKKMWNNKFSSMTVNFGQTVLHTAAECDASDLLPFFLQKGMKVDATDRDGRSPLHIAARNDYDNVAQILVSKGANINLEDKLNGRSPLHIAARYNCKKVAEILIRNGAKINLATKLDGHTPLHIAASKNNDKVTEILVRNGADINLVDKLNRWSPLYIAAFNNCDKVAEILVRNGANTNLVDELNGWSPLHIAAIYNHSKIAEILVKNRANFDLVDKLDGHTPLHIAARYNYDKLAEILVRNGANMNLEDKKGQKPLQIAHHYKSNKCIFILNQARPAEIAQKSDSEKSIFILNQEHIINTDDVDAFKQANGSNGLRLNKEFVDLISKVNPQKIIAYIGSLHISEEEIAEAKLWRNIQPFHEINLYRALKSTHCKMYEDSVTVDLINRDSLLSDKCALQLAIDGNSVIMVSEVLKLIHEYNDELEAKLEICKETNNMVYNILQNRKATLGQWYDKGYSRLDVAVADGSIRMIEYLLKEVNNKDVISKTLSIAMDYNNVKCVNILTKYRPDYNFTNKMGQTLLHSAVENRSRNIYNILVHKCTNFDKRDYLGLTALQRAVIYKEERLIKEILKKDKYWNRKVYITKPKEHSIFDEKVESINICYELWEKEFPTLIKKMTEKETTLSLSVKTHSNDEWEIFFNNSTQHDVKFQDGLGNSVLHTAVSNFNVKMCDKIVEISKETLQLKNLEGLSPLRLAVQKAMDVECNNIVALETVDCLINVGASLEQNEPNKVSILQEAITSTNEELLIILLQSNENITSFTESEFQIIIKKQFHKFIQLLVKKFPKGTAFKYLSEKVIIDFFKAEKYCLLMSLHRYINDTVKNATYNEYLFVAYKERNKNLFIDLCEKQNIKPKFIDDKETIMTLLVKDDDKTYFSYIIHGKVAGALINFKNGTMNLPLHLVLMKRWYSVGHLVIKYTENLDEENGDGNTPLAILTNQLGSMIDNILEVGELLPLIYALIDRKCNIYTVSSISGRSPISYAGKYRLKIETYYEEHSGEKRDCPSGAVGNVTSKNAPVTGVRNCFICDDRSVNCVLDCGHTFCRICIDNIDRCPNCREAIQFPKKIYL